MKLGILVNTDRHPDHLEGIAKAALSKGHEVMVFFMDDGVRLIADPRVTSLCEHPSTNISYCDYSTQCIGVSKDRVSEKIVCGSQFNNATMNHEADRVIVL